MAETIIKKDAIELYEHDMSLYSIIVNRRRALPSVNDGLKVVQRRIIYESFEEGLYNGRNTKSALLTGLVAGKLHAHSPEGVYNSIITMANWFTIKYPIMDDFDTGYGTADGAPASAQRYTHAGLTKFGYEMFAEELSKSKNIVDWTETYLRDGSLEPDYLPAKLPSLLINGAQGIALGKIIAVPSHNLGEVIDVTRKLLRDPKATYCLIPDLQQACEIFDTNWKEINETGSGSFKARGTFEIEQDKKTGDYTLHIRSLPPRVYGDQVYNKILDMIEDKKLPMVKEVFSTLVKKDGRPDIIVKLRSGADPEYVKQIIYAQTAVSQTIPINFEAVAKDGLQVLRFNYRD